MTDELDRIDRIDETAASEIRARVLYDDNPDLLATLRLIRRLIAVIRAQDARITRLVNRVQP